MVTSALYWKIHSYFKFDFARRNNTLRLITTLVTRPLSHYSIFPLHQIVKRFQGEVEIVLHNGNRIEVIKNTLSVIHEDEIIFNFDNRKISYVMVTNILPSKHAQTYPIPTYAKVDGPRRSIWPTSDVRPSILTDKSQ